MSRYYKQGDDGFPVKCETLEEAFGKTESARKSVAQETIGEARVSTVFLVVDHGWGEGEPVLWETMVFGGPLDQDQDRCSGHRDNAVAMHARMVERVKEATK